MLRRTKADRSLVPDLPDKIETVEHTTLTREQAGLYQAIVDEFIEAVATRSGMERRGLVLATLTRLKQVCNHPAHFLREDTVGEAARSGKLDRFDDLIDAILDADERVLVFSQYREMGSLEFSKQLLKEAKVAVSPGVGFGQYGDDHVRFALIENEHRTRQALRGIRKMFRNHSVES